MGYGGAGEGEDAGEGDWERGLFSNEGRMSVISVSIDLVDIYVCSEECLNDNGFLTVERLDQGSTIALIDMIKIYSVIF